MQPFFKMVLPAGLRGQPTQEIFAAAEITLYPSAPQSLLHRRRAKIVGIAAQKYLGFPGMVASVFENAM